MTSTTKDYEVLIAAHESALHNLQLIKTEIAAIVERLHMLNKYHFFPRFSHIDYKISESDIELLQKLSK